MSWPFTKLPILQAPTGSIAGPELCTAVMEAGGMGAMGLTWTQPETAREFVRQVRSRTDGLFQVNFVLHFQPKALTVVLEEGAPAITFSWGIPHGYVDLVKSFGALLGVQVGTAKGAKAAKEIGADFIICQGVEAGGHVQSSTPLDRLLPEVLRVAGETPVVAAGGLADGEDIRRVLDAGASAAMLGTRFVATKESRAHPIYKQKLIEARETALTLCFDGGWPYAQHRVLRNSTFEAWEAAGCPASGSRPGEGEMVSAGVEMYDDTAPRLGMQGDIERMCMYAGAGVGRITDIPSAAELMARVLGKP